MADWIGPPGPIPLGPKTKVPWLNEPNPSLGLIFLKDAQRHPESRIQSWLVKIKVKHQNGSGDIFSFIQGLVNTSK
jgi:hypothetical protein